MSWEPDRHKVPRSFESGAAKRKIAQDKKGNEAKVIAKTRRITDFITSMSSQSQVHAPQDKDLKEWLPPSSSSEDVQDEASDDDKTKLQDEPEDDNKLEANKPADEICKPVEIIQPHLLSTAIVVNNIGLKPESVSDSSFVDYWAKKDCSTVMKTW